MHDSTFSFLNQNLYRQDSRAFIMDMHKFILFALVVIVVACTNPGLGDQPDPPEDTTVVITPTEGPIGTSFAITDPLGRMESDDVVLFYPEGSDPGIEGVPANGVTVSGDGKTLTGTVPVGLAEGQQHYVTVRDEPQTHPKFGDVSFMVTL